LKKLIQKNNYVSEKLKSTIDFNVVAPLKIVQFHEATREALKQYVSNIEKENLELKQKIKEL
jgi:hypothetical protein